MPVAKHLSYARSRSRKEQPRRIDGLSFTYPSLQYDEAPRAQHASSQRPEIAQTPVASRSIIRNAAQFAETVGETIFIVVAWLLSEILDGCAAYTLAMYGLPAAINDKTHSDVAAPRQSYPLGHRSQPALQLISPDIGAGKILSSPDSVRSAQPARGRSSWRTAVIAPAVWLLSKIRERSARRRLIAELRCLDDRSLHDIGISRTDIGHIARYGVRPE